MTRALSFSHTWYANILNEQGLSVTVGDNLAARGIKLSLGGQVYDPTDPMGKMFFNILATFAEFEDDLLRMGTREGMAVARAKGRLKGRQPKLTTKQQAELRRMRGTGDYTITDLAELFNISRPTVYRTRAAVESVPAQRGRRR
ncbi:MAG TPA: recombinase family protein [Gemmatimonadales bacterium]|nr:recombinase family protein [Gemmatimonadales bacterium]